MLEVKYCVKCGRIQPISEFHRNRTNKDGLDNRCKLCKKEEARKERETNYFQAYIRSKKSECIQKNIPFNLTSEYIEAIWTGRCAIIDEPIYYMYDGHGSHHGNQAHLDRIHPNKGYVVGNVAWVSGRINRIKYNATIDELEKVIKYLKKHSEIDNKEE